MAGRAMPRRSVQVVAALLTLAVLGACSGGKGPVTSAPGEQGPRTAPPPGTDCNWPMWGHNLSRTFSYPCATGITPATVKGLQKRWFFNTADVVTATPAVVDGTLYVGDWAARFYAIDTETGTPRWTFQADVAKNVYAGQIVSSAAVADVGGVPTVFFGDGPMLYALRADNGELRWKKSVGTGTDDDFTEIESSPVVVDGKVIFGTDVHNHEDQRAGVFALDAATGDEVWRYDPDENAAGGASGCVDVWGSVAVDTGRRGVYFGTGSCDTKNMRWQPTSEAIIGIDLDTGRRRWTFQPHEASRADLDFAGAPNLFDADGRAAVGLGSKDGTYYALDRDTGALLWKAKATDGGPAGGFIGPAVHARGIIAGGTAVGSPPFVHAINARDGSIVWQNPKPQATYAASAEANGVLFLGGIDFTFRALDLGTGEILWSQEMPGGVAGGAVVVGDDVFAVNGLREPGQDKHSTTSGVYRFSLHAATGGSGGETTSSTAAATDTTARAAGVASLANPPGSQPCIGAPCPMTFLNNVPDGLTPTITLEVTPDPFRITVTSSGLGDPKQWVKPGSAAAEQGAKAFALFASESDETLQGGLVCVLDASGSCTADTLPSLATYNRLTLLAVNDTSGMPTPSEGIARLVVTRSFEPPLTPRPSP
jgi:polyvinyl alcohol dehydrogenase (cytochrome)